MSRRKQLARDFRTCHRCGYIGLLWPPRDSRQTNKPLDSAQPMYLDMDDPAPDAEGYDRYGYRIRGRRVADLAAHEQRSAERGTRSAEDGARRIVKVWPIHACERGSPEPCLIGKPIEGETERQLALVRGSAPQPAEALNKAEEISLFYEALADMDDESDKAIVLCRMNQGSLGKAAEAMGVGVGKVRSASDRFAAVLERKAAERRG